LAIVCVAGVVPAEAPAKNVATPNSEKLRQAVPLDYTPATATSTPARASAAAQPQATQIAGPTTLVPAGNGSGPSWIVLLAAAVGGAACVLVPLAVLQRRRAAGPRVDVGSVDLPEPPRLPATALRPSAAAPLRVAPVERESSRTPGSRDASVCQVRWSRRAGRFYAVTTDSQGVERRLANSPPFEWPHLSPPPEESREAQAALRELAKELREKGWRPLRAKGFDFDERRWYARRFRWPTQAEAAQATTSPPGQRTAPRA
jgi:hypothetical protein